MQLRDHHEMYWRDRVDVVKRQQLVVFVHLAAGNFAACDFAKNAFCHSLSLDTYDCPSRNKMSGLTGDLADVFWQPSRMAIQSSPDMVGTAHPTLRLFFPAFLFGK